MRSFSPSEAAFEGFRVIRSQPGAVLVWSLAYMLAQVAIVGVILALFGGTFATVVQSSGGTAAAMSPEAAQRLIGSGLLMALVLTPVALVFGAVFLDAVFRPVLRPTDRGVFYLKLGADEGRLILLFLAWIGIALLAYLAVAIVSLLLIAISAAAAHGGRGAALPGLMVAVIVLATLCGAVWLMVRFSLAAPMTFAEKRVRVFASWGVTKGRFWSLFGCYLLAWIFGLLILIGGWIVSLCAGAVITGDWGTVSSAAINPTRAMMGSGAAGFAHMLTVAGVVQLLINGLVQSVARVVMYAPMAAAYRDLTGPEESMIAEGEFCPLPGMAV